MTVVDVIPEEDIEASRKKSAKAAVRSFVCVRLQKVNRTAKKTCSFEQVFLYPCYEICISVGSFL